VGLVLLVAFLPVWIFLATTVSGLWEWMTAVLVSAQVVHLILLWKSVHYLAVLRFLALPIRSLIVPLVFLVARIESIREEAPTLYKRVSAPIQVGDTSDSRSPLLKDHIMEEESRRRRKEKDVRKRYKKMEVTFRRNLIRHETRSSDTSLNLSHVVPVMWEHQKRVCEAEGKNLAEEFLKRFLVVTVLPKSIMDYYYDAQVLCAVSMSIQQSKVFHPMMYFSLNSATKSGIWFHATGTAIERAKQIPGIEFVCAGVHQTQTKRNAGFEAVEHTENTILSDLYPYSFAVSPPTEVLTVSLWQRSTDASPG
jgi:hypothetical protein